MLRVIEDLAADWRRLDERMQGLSSEIEVLARRDVGCERLMGVPGIGPIISSAMVAAIGRGDAFTKGRDFAAWLGLVPFPRSINASEKNHGLRFEGILKIDCEQIALQRPKTGKFDYLSGLNHPAYSIAFKFFTDDKLMYGWRRSRRSKHSNFHTWVI
jgi:transposase